MRNPLRHHNKNHPDGVPFDECRICGRDRAVCARKLRFASWQEASEWVEEYNVSHGYVDPVTRYACRWCGAWHMKTAKDPRARWRAEKARRKWLVAQRSPTIHTAGGTPAG